jgi:CyaY protein
MMPEQEYRHLVDATLRRIDAAFESIDPDLAECSISQGALTILFHGKLRCIVSPQPPVRQMWLAFRDTAWHFDWNAETQGWVDDKGRGELYPVVATITRETAAVDVTV